MVIHRLLMFTLCLAVATFARPVLAEDPQTAGETVAGETVAGETVAGEKATGEKAEEPPASRFLRIHRDEDEKPLAMEVAIVSYVSANASRSGLVVDLIGAVHVADKSYFDQLNKRFESYDVLLYELVAPEGTRIEKDGENLGNSPVSALQGGMKEMLDLEFQLECIDYTRDNFVHADMSPEEFAKSMRDRNESFLQILFRAMGLAMAQQAKDPNSSGDVDILLALFAKDRSLRLKRIVAEQFDQTGGEVLLFGGKNGSTIITERNKKALSVLAEQIKGDKKRIGIFYGAGHLPDMEQRLLNEFGLRRSKETWLRAWNLEK